MDKTADPAFWPLVGCFALFVIVGLVVIAAMMFAEAEHRTGWSRAIRMQGRQRTH